MLLVVMGVAGAGKSTLAAAVAEALGWVFVEGDALHPPENVAAMRAGRPLTDRDREPWLEAVAARMAALDARGLSAAVACSALKAAYRARLRAAGREVRFVGLRVEPDLARRRIAARAGHFMTAALVESQFVALEPALPGERVLDLDAAAPLDANVAATVAYVAAQVSATPGSAC